MELYFAEAVTLTGMSYFPSRGLVSVRGRVPRSTRVSRHRWGQSRESLPTHSPYLSTPGSGLMYGPQRTLDINPSARRKFKPPRQSGLQPLPINIENTGGNAGPVEATTSRKEDPAHKLGKAAAPKTAAAGPSKQQSGRHSGRLCSPLARLRRAWLRRRPRRTRRAPAAARLRRSPATTNYCAD